MDRGMLNDATSSDDSPIAGYLLQEIAKQTLGSYPACQQLEEFVVKRLEKDNHNIKYKTLLIIKHVCRSGRAEFKKDMGRFVGPIKDCLQFKGVPDPLRGDEPYKRVRDLAKDTLEAIFDSQMPVTTSHVTAQGRIQGIAGGQQVDNAPRESQRPGGDFYNRAVHTMNGGDDPSRHFQSMGSGGGYSDNTPPNANQNYYNGTYGVSASPGNNNNNGSGGAPGQQYSGGSGGFGNQPDPRMEKSWTERATEAGIAVAQGLSAASDSLGINRMAGGSGGSEPYRPGGGGQPQAQAGAEYQFRSNRGPGSVNGAYRDSPPQLPGGNGKAWPEHMQPQMVPAGSSPQQPSNVHNSHNQNGNSSLGRGKAGAAASDGAYEEGVVQTLCDAAGLKPVPQEEKLRQFLSDAPTLSPELIGFCLQDQMCAVEGAGVGGGAVAWQSRVKAALVAQALVCNIKCTAHRAWWAQESNLTDVRQLLLPEAKDRGGLKKEVRKLMEQLGVGSLAAAVGGAQAQGDLLFGGADDGGSDSSVSVPQVVDTSGADLADIFGGMSTSSGGAPPIPLAPAPMGSLLDSFTSPPPAPAAGEVDIFSGMGMGIGMATTQPQSQPQQGRFGPVDDLLGGGGGGGGERNNASPGSSGFFFMGEGGEAPVAAPVANAVIAANVGNSTGFDFMGGGGGGGEVAAQTSASAGSGIDGMDLLGASYDTMDANPVGPPPSITSFAVPPTVAPPPSISSFAVPPQPQRSHSSSSSLSSLTGAEGEGGGGGDFFEGMGIGIRQGIRMASAAPLPAHTQSQLPGGMGMDLLALGQCKESGMPPPQQVTQQGNMNMMQGNMNMQQGNINMMQQGNMQLQQMPNNGNNGQMQMGMQSQQSQNGGNMMQQQMPNNNQMQMGMQSQQSQNGGNMMQQQMPNNGNNGNNGQMQMGMQQQQNSPNMGNVGMMGAMGGGSNPQQMMQSRSPQSLNTNNQQQKKADDVSSLLNSNDFKM